LDVEVSLNLRLRPLPGAEPAGDETCTNEDELYRGSEVGGRLIGCVAWALRFFGEFVYSKTPGKPAFRWQHGITSGVYLMVLVEDFHLPPVKMGEPNDGSKLMVMLMPTLAVSGALVTVAPHLLIAVEGAPILARSLLILEALEEADPLDRLKEDLMAAWM
jgi:hypothetical protein